MKTSSTKKKEPRLQKSKRVLKPAVERTGPKKLSPFDFLNSINDGPRGNDLMIDCFADSGDGAVLDSADKSYIPFIVNRGLSYFQDSILYANAMNERAVLPAKMQYDFLRFGLRPRKRFSKWSKKADDSSDVTLIMAEYNYSSDKARDALKLFDADALIELRNRHEKGGTGKNIK
jgi:hypothetical protein